MKGSLRARTLVIAIIALALVGWSGGMALAGARGAHHVAVRSAATEADGSPETTITATPAVVTPEESSQTFELVGGTVTFSCRGDLISLVSVMPNSGFSVESEVENGGQEIKVSFESARHESEIRAACVGGQVQAIEIREEDDNEVPAVPAPSPSPTVSSRAFELVGGTVTFSCSAELISLVSAVPNSGFGVERETEEGGQEVKVRFESETHRSEIRATCVGGQVQATRIREESR